MRLVGPRIDEVFKKKVELELPGYEAEIRLEQPKQRKEVKKRQPYRMVWKQY